MSDKLVFDLAQEVEGSPNVFIRKDWLNILDNQNQNYNNNQSVLDTSQLSNSNKYMSYREAYFLIPLLLSVQQVDVPDADHLFSPASRPADYSVGLKNWFGQIIHSFTLDYNGTTIIQQTPYVNMWNSFKLMTSLSYGDIITQGATIGFYPDDPTAWTWSPCPTVNAGVFQVQPPQTIGGAATNGNAPCSFCPDNLGYGMGVCNNANALGSVIAKNVGVSFSQYNSGTGNKGYIHRQTYINYDAIQPANADSLASANVSSATLFQVAYSTNYSQILSSENARQLWKSYVMTKTDAVAGTSRGLLQISVMATVYLKHIHSFFNMCPLLKGVFMKMTMNLNNTTTSFEAGYTAEQVAGAPIRSFLACSGVANPLGGINPAMISALTKSKVYDITDITDNTATITAAAVAGNTFSMGSATGMSISSANVVQPAGTISVTGAGGAPPNGVFYGTGTSVSNTATLGAVVGQPTGFTGTGGAGSITGGAGSITGGATVGINLTNAVVGLTGAIQSATVPNGGNAFLPSAPAANRTIKFKYNLSVGGRCLDATMPNVPQGTQALSVYLYIPAYTFNPVFEQAYLSSPVKQIKYTDIYQYQVINVAGGGNGNFNNLLTNGIANVKSVLILPYFSANPSATNATITDATRTGAYATEGSTIQVSTNTGFLAGYPVFQSPFDPAGTGATSPLALIKNFNVQISGQNAIYNLEKYAFEQFNNQLYGQNAVNGGLTDGITSGLVDRLGFDMEYCYYYVNVERMLPVEMSVPKSVQILGQMCCQQAVDLYCFIEYGVEISIDALTGARV